MLAGTADVVMTAPGVVAVFVAVCEASRTCCANALAMVLAGPTFLGTVVGFAFSDTPGSSYSSGFFVLVASATFSVVVEAVAFNAVSGGGSMFKPVVFRPPRLSSGGGLVAFSVCGGRGGFDFRFSESFAFFLGFLICPEDCKLSSISS